MQQLVPMKMQLFVPQYLQQHGDDAYYSLNLLDTCSTAVLHHFWNF